MDLNALASPSAELAMLNQMGDRLGVETRLRPVATTAVSILDNTRNLREKRGWFGAEGTITVFIGRSAGSIERVKMAVERGDEEIRAISEEILTSPQDRPESLEQALSDVAAAPVFATFLYGGQKLVENLHIPNDRDLIGFTLPYNGGRLAPQGFELRQFHTEGTALYEAFALQTMPELTDAERAALEQVPEPDLWLNVGTLNACAWVCGAAALSGAVAGGLLGAAVGGAGGAVVGAVVGGALGGAAYNYVTNHIGGDADSGGHTADTGDAGADTGSNPILRAFSLLDDDVVRLGSVGTARALLELRRTALLRAVAN